MVKAKDNKKAAVDTQDSSFQDDDDSLVIDMENVKAQSFEVIPKGTYNVVIEKCEYKRSESSNQPMWEMTMAITDGDFANRKLFTFMSFSEKALPGTKASIQKIAPALLEGSFSPKKIADNGDLIGVVARVKTKIEPYNGEDRTKVAQWLAPEGSGDGFAE